MVGMHAAGAAGQRTAGAAHKTLVKESAMSAHPLQGADTAPAPRTRLQRQCQLPVVNIKVECALGAVQPKLGGGLASGARH